MRRAASSSRSTTGCSKASACADETTPTLAAPQSGRASGLGRPRAAGMQEQRVKICGFVGFGEVASRFAKRLHERGATVIAYDVFLDRPAGRDALVARAAGTPVEFSALPQMIARADIVLSTVTTDVALAAAKQCVPLLRKRQIYVDLNATAP